MAKRTVRHGRDVLALSGPPKRHVVDAVMDKEHAAVANQGAVHVLWGYLETTATWKFFCGIDYAGNAHSDYISEEPITCIQCKALSSRDLSGLKTPW